MTDDYRDSSRTYTNTGYPSTWYYYDRNFSNNPLHLSHGTELTITGLTKVTESTTVYRSLTSAGYGNGRGFYVKTDWTSDDVRKTVTTSTYDSSNDEFWVATRWTNVGYSTRAQFGLGVIDQHGYCGSFCGELYGPRAGSPGSTHGIRPVIAFPRSLYKLQLQSDGTYNIVKK